MYEDTVVVAKLQGHVWPTKWCWQRVLAGKLVGKLAAGFRPVRWWEDLPVTGRQEELVFTGIVEELGEVVEVERLADAARITVLGPTVARGARLGDSIAVNGVCLTATSLAGDRFSADVMAETLARTNLGMLAPGSAVNLERPLQVDSRFGGHIVQGHVDAVGSVLSRHASEHWEMVRIGFPPEYAGYLVEKGSVTVDGVSLTVVEIDDGSNAGVAWFSVSLIPTTLACTTLGQVGSGECVNLEFDILAKYIERLLQARS